MGEKGGESMARYRRSKSKATSWKVLCKGQQRGIKAEKVMDLALEKAEKYIGLPRPEQSDYSLSDLFSIMLYAAAEGTTIQQAAEALQKGPHANTVRQAISGLQVERLQAESNRALASCLPAGLLGQPLEVALDLKLICYYGQAQAGEEDFIVTGAGRQGTNKFFAYASIYVIRQARRFTLALCVVRKDQSLEQVVSQLLARFHRLGGRLRCLHLDRQFYQVPVLRWLKRRDLPFCIATPERGKKAGIKGLMALGPWAYKYTVRGQKHGKVKVTVAIVGKYWKGRWGKHGRKLSAFVPNNFPFSWRTAFERYRRRFGIETSHRVWKQARGWTTARAAAFRLLLVGLAVLLHNLWICIKWLHVNAPRRGGRLVLHSWFTFRRLLFFLARAIERIYGSVLEVFVPT